MKKSYVLLAAVCLIISIILNYQSPMNSGKGFVLNGNALSENAGFEENIGMNYKQNKDSLDTTTENIEKKISEEITKQNGNLGVGKTFLLEKIDLKSNIATNIGYEDEYIEILPEINAPADNEIEVVKPEKNEADYNKKENSNILESFDTEASNVTYMGNFKLTAYCPCSKCCGKWGENRPLDENGKMIVTTASGARAYANHTIAVDPKVIPYGTTVIIERNGVYYEYVAEDCGGSIKNNRIDVFFDSHTVACDFGIRYGNVYIITNNEN